MSYSVTEPSARQKWFAGILVIFSMGYLTYLGAAAGSPNLIEMEVAPEYEKGKVVVAQSGCLACHSADKKIVGPSFKDIAAKYKGQDAVATLMQKVRTGGKGSFGVVPMAPTGPEKISDADLKAAVELILKS